LNKAYTSHTKNRLTVNSTTDAEEYREHYKVAVTKPTRSRQRVKPTSASLLNARAESCTCKWGM